MNKLTFVQVVMFVKLGFLKNEITENDSALAGFLASGLSPEDAIGKVREAKAALDVLIAAGFSSEEIAMMREESNPLKQHSKSPGSQKRPADPSKAGQKGYSPYGRKLGKPSKAERGDVEPVTSRSNVRVDYKAQTGSVMDPSRKWHKTEKATATLTELVTGGTLVTCDVYNNSLRTFFALGGKERGIDIRFDKDSKGWIVPAGNEDLVAFGAESTCGKVECTPLHFS